MPTYVAFLRAINLGANRKFAKADIVAACERAGCTDVATHINTGNVLVKTALRSRGKLETALEREFLAARGFEVPTIAFTPGEVLGIVADAEEISTAYADIGMQYVSLLKEPPPAGAVAEAAATSYDGEHLVVRGRAAHLLLEAHDGYHAAKLDNAWVEKRMGVSTNRNINVLRAIAQKWCGTGDGSTPRS